MVELKPKEEVNATIICMDGNIQLPRSMTAIDPFGEVSLNANDSFFVPDERVERYSTDQEAVSLVLPTIMVKT